MRRRDRIRARVAVTPRQFLGVAWITMIALAVIVLSGAAVRLSGSGLGCYLKQPG